MNLILINRLLWVGFILFFQGHAFAIWPFDGADPKATNSAPATQSGTSLPQTAPNPRAGMAASFSTGIKQAMPSVVSIYTTEIIKSPNRNNPILNDPFFKQFFGEQFNKMPQEYKGEVLGSGVIISKDGYIVTNHHVVQGATKIRVRLWENRKDFTAKLIGSDELTDLAVLKIEGANFPSILLADSEAVQVGDIVFAIGNPLNVGQTVTMGIASAVGRSGLQLAHYENFIQTDASINQGNSGGALIDSRGQLIGINTAIYSQTGGNIGIGFAVPVNLVRSIMESLIKHGRVVRGYVGVELEDVTLDLATGLGLPVDMGAIVMSVGAGSPGAKAGLLRDDVITEIDGVKVVDRRAVQLKISQTAPGKTVTLRVFRGGKDQLIKVQLEELVVNSKQPTVPVAPLAATPPKSNLPDLLDGIEIASVDARIRQVIRAPANVKGVVVMEINRTPITDADQAIALSEKLEQSKIMVLLVWTKGHTRYVTLRE